MSNFKVGTIVEEALRLGLYILTAFVIYGIAWIFTPLPI